MSCIPSVVGLNKTPREVITCTPVNTDVAAAAVIPTGTRRLVVAAEALAFLAFGEDTSATVGVPIPAGEIVCIELALGGGDDTVHVQSPTDATDVYVTYMK